MTFDLNEPTQHETDPARVAVYPCHYMDYNGGEPIGYAVNQMEADDILRAYYAPMPAPPLCPLGQHDRNWKGEQVWGWWTASAAENGATDG
jgi:hypothetical protein